MSRFGYCYDPYDAGWHGHAQPGALALRDECRRLFGGVGDLGIVRDRSRCRQKRSAHCHGRAWDAAIPSGQKALGDELARFLVTMAPELGVQRVIWWRREWDSRPGQRWWSPYGGHPHRDHVHVELCWDAARHLRPEHVREAHRAWKGADDDMPSIDEIRELLEAEVPQLVRREVDEALERAFQHPDGWVKGNGPTTLEHGLSKVHEIWARLRRMDKDFQGHIEVEDAEEA